MTIETLGEVMQYARSIRHEQTRRESEDYLEMVMFRESWDDLRGLFESYFGPALKPLDEPPTQEAERVSSRYGGIVKEQAFYRSLRENFEHVAMVWPWSDGKRMTVKITQEVLT